MPAHGIGKYRPQRLLTLMITVVVSLATIALTAGIGVATSQPPGPPDRGPAASAPVDFTSPDGSFEGQFVPSRFAAADSPTGLEAIGQLTGTVTRGGQTQQVNQPLTLDVLQITGTCDILNLVLGPLDLDLLGLQVHLDQVVLEITAQQGPGNLLGNLLCAVAGLLDNPSGNVNGLVGLLNNILRQLGLGG